MKYKKLCNEVLDVIKKENIQDVFYCVTRLRIVVKSKENIDKDVLNNIDGIIQVKEVGNQLQLVIGAHVKDVYDEFCEISGFGKDDSSVEEVQSTSSKPTGSLGARFLGTLSSIFLPLLPILIAGGMIKSFVIILTSFHLIADTSGVVTILNAIGDAPLDRKSTRLNSSH